MIYGSSNATSALGSLLRKMQEETQTNPAKIPAAAAESSPIREQIQGPLSNPESVGSEKVVAMKPELNPSQETPSPVAPTNIPVDAAGAGAPVGAAGAAIGASPVVGPTNIVPPVSPDIPSGITSPTAPKNNNPTPTPTIPNNNSNVGVGSKQPATSLSTTPLQPSASKSIYEQLNSGKQTYITKPSSSTNRATGGTVENVGAKAGSGAGISAALKNAGSLIPTVLKSVLGSASTLAGTIMSKSTLNQIMDQLKYGKSVQRT